MNFIMNTEVKTSKTTVEVQSLKLRGKSGINNKKKKKVR